jgi:CBS domain-containing protein
MFLRLDNTKPKESVMQIRDVMTENVRTVRPDTALPDVARIMRDEDIGVVPVADNDRLVGMVTDRDIVVRAVAEGEGVERQTAGEVMSPKIACCREDDDVEDVLRNMGEQQVRRLPVVDSEMRVVGIVSLGDLSRTAQPAEAGESLAEISSPSSSH